MARRYTDLYERVRMLGGAMVSPEEASWQTTIPPRVDPVPVILHVSCNVHLTPHVYLLAQEFLRRLGVEFVVVGGPENCCGNPQHHFGDHDLGAMTTRIAFANFRRFKPERVLTICPSCDETFSEAFAREGFGVPVHNISRFLVERLSELRRMCMQQVGRVIALHSHAGSTVYDQDRANVTRLLEIVPGVTLVPTGSAVSEQPRCNAFFPPTPAAMAAMFDEARANGVEALVNVYHSCYRENLRGESGWGIRVRHYLDILAEAAGIAYEEPNRQLLEMRTIGRIMQAMRPNIEARGLDAETVQRYAEPFFGAGGPK